MVPRNHEEWPAEALQECGRAHVLGRSSTVRQVAADDDQLRVEAFQQRADRALDLRLLVRARMQVGDVEHPSWHGGAGYRLASVIDEPAELFDDLYLGLRPGRALRKKRRREPLTSEEEEAVGRWQRLSSWRKAVTLVAFAVGTFGLGFTLGGLVFGRWRKA